MKLTTSKLHKSLYGIMKMKKIIFVLLSAVIATTAHAEQSSRFDSAWELLEKDKGERAKKERERAAHLLSSRPEGIPSNGLNLGRIPAPATQAPIDLEKLAKSLNAPGVSTGNTTKMKIYISFSMPEESIQLMIDQAHLLGRDYVSLAVVGLIEDDWKKTIPLLRKMVKGKDVEISIDPDGFKKHEVNLVPSFVLYRDDPAEEARCSLEGDQAGLDRLKNFVGVAGDVSIDYALEHFISKEPEWRLEAQKMLAVIAPKLGDYSTKVSFQ